MQEIMQFIRCHLILGAIWFSLLIAVLFIILRNIISQIKIITCNETIFLINRKDAFVIDLRKYDDFQKGHIACSINLLSTEIEDNNPNINRIKQKNRPIIIVDDIGSAKVRTVAKMLYKAGFKEIFVLKDGIYGWKRENLPLVQKR